MPGIVKLIRASCWFNPPSGTWSKPQSARKGRRALARGTHCDEEERQSPRRDDTRLGLAPSTLLHPPLLHGDLAHDDIVLVPPSVEARQAEVVPASITLAPDIAHVPDGNPARQPAAAAAEHDRLALGQVYHLRIQAPLHVARDVDDLAHALDGGVVLPDVDQVVDHALVRDARGVVDPGEGVRELVEVDAQDLEDGAEGEEAGVGAVGGGAGAVLGDAFGRSDGDALPAMELRFHGEGRECDVRDDGLDAELQGGLGVGLGVVAEFSLLLVASRSEEGSEYITCGSCSYACCTS